MLASAALVLLGARAAEACSCGANGTALDEYESVDTVVVARAVAVEKADDKDAVDGVRSTRMSVEKSYKGNFKPGDEFMLGQGGGADCIWTFSEESVGHRYLFYLKTLGKREKVLLATTCGRSGVVERRGDDLLYLDNLSKVRGKTRISGTVEFEKETELSAAGRTVRVRGAGGKTYELKTDANGVYEIYDLPPGRYIVEPETPEGWKVDDFRLNYSPSVVREAREGARRARPVKIQIILEPRRHASLDIHFEIENAVRGRVFDPEGRPLKGVCVNAVLPNPEENAGYQADCTDASGAFAITELPPGNYILVVNRAGKVSSSAPFKTFYYPNVTERERAGVVHVGAGDDLKGFDIYAPYAEETVTVEGVLLYSDGRAAAGTHVRFKASKEKEGVESYATAEADAKGHFSVKILKGSEGELYGEILTFPGQYEDCPKLEAILRKMGAERTTEVRTPALKFKADANLFDVELKFPFPLCRKAKIE